MASPPSTFLPPFFSKRRGKPGGNIFLNERRRPHKKGERRRNPQKQDHVLPFPGAILSASFLIFHLREIQNFPFQKVFALTFYAPRPRSLSKSRWSPPPISPQKTRTKSKEVFPTKSWRSKEGAESEEAAKASIIADLLFMYRPAIA